MRYLIVVIIGIIIGIIAIVYNAPGILIFIAGTMVGTNLILLVVDLEKE